MAVIQIPIGGRAVPIEVPNFAMEDTQQSILSVSQQIRDAISRRMSLDKTVRIIVGPERSLTEPNG